MLDVPQFGVCFDAAFPEAPMARGFESKSVADQQESAQLRRSPRTRAAAALNPALVARKRRLELARADVERRLTTASVPAHRQMLERALRALVNDLRSLED